MRQPNASRLRSRRFRRLLVESLEPRRVLAGDITTGLVHYWTFDETSGDTAHDSVGGSDGALVNWNATEPKWEPGRVGGALHFGTADDYVIAQPSPMTGTFAVSFWLNVTDRSGTNPRILEARVGNAVLINNDSERGVGFVSNNNTSDPGTYDPSLPTFNTWEHYAINFNAATGEGVVYRGDAPVATGVFHDNVPLLSWVFGHSSDLLNNSDSLNGALDDFRVYDRLLSSDDIQLLAAQGTLEPTHQGPVHDWTFDETTGVTAHDVAGAADAALLNWAPDEPSWVAGKVGGALAFTTADNAVITPPLGTHAQWSVAFWVDVTGRGGTNPRIVGPQDGRELWAYLDLENDGGGAFMSHNIRTYETAAIPLNTWQHYAITYDTGANVATVYHNGVAVASGPFHDNATVQAWVFGHNCDLANDTDSLDGLLDDLREYDRLLTPAEIQRLSSLTPVVVTNDAYTLSHNTSLDVPAGQGVLTNDSDLDDSSPHVVVAVGPAHGTLTLKPDGSFTYQPLTNFNGSDSFTYRLQDSRGNDVAGTVSLTITPVNQAPAFTKGPDVSVSDEQPFGPQVSVVSFDGLKGATGQGVPFTAYTEQGFTVTPVTDGWRILGTSSPTPTAGGNPPPAIWEETFNSSLQVTSATGGAFTFSGLDMMGPSAAITFTGLFNGQTVFSATTIVPPDVIGLFQPIASPSGATIDKLIISIQRNNTENTEIDNVRLAGPNWATDLSPGAPDESGQSLAFLVHADHPELFEAQPAINPYGQLTFTPQPNVSGMATVTVTLHDDGGTANGGSDTSPPQTFQIAITKPHLWGNSANPLDTNSDGFVVAGDALAVINYLNGNLPTDVPPTAAIGGPYGFLDTEHDDHVAPIDALQIINFINAGGQSGPAGSAIFVGKDYTTSGDWQSKYGADGYALAIGVASLPTYAQLSFSGKYDFVSDNHAGEDRALQYVDTTYRFAADWTGHNSASIPLNGFVMDLNLTDNRSHRVAIYILDWNTTSRSEQIDVLDASTGDVLNSQLSGPFHDGQYLVWELRGHVQIRFTNLANGLNAVASGIFFG